MIRRRTLLFAAMVGVAIFASHARGIDSLWLTPVNGGWGDPTKWSTNPTWPNGTQYRVTIDAAGAPYTVTLPTPPLVTAGDVTIDSPDATLVMGVGTTFSAPNGLHVENGTALFNAGVLSNTRLSTGAGGTVRLGTSTTTAHLSNVTLAAEMRATFEARTSNALTFDGGTLYAADGFIGGSLLGNGEWVLSSLDACGTGCRLDYDGSPAIEIAAGVTMRSAGRRVSMIETTNHPSAMLINRGTLVAHTAGGYWYIERLQNEGIIRVSNGDSFQAGFYGHVGQLELGPGGTMTVYGAPDFNLPTTIAGFTLILAASGGLTTSEPLRLESGTIVIDHAASVVPINSTGGVVSISTSLTPAQLAAMPIAGPAVVRMAGSAYSFDGSLDLAGGIFDYTSAGYNWDFSQGYIRNGTFTGPNSELSVGGVSGFNQAVRFENVQIDVPLRVDGTVQAQGSTTFVKPVVVNGGSLTLLDAWTNTGGISVNGGRLHLATAPAALGAIEFDHGELQIGFNTTLTEAEALQVGTPDRVFMQQASSKNLGTMDLEGGTLDLDASPFAWGVGSLGRMVNGQINGTLGGAVLVLRGGKLENVSLDSVRLNGTGTLSGVNGTNVWMNAGFATTTSLTDSRIDSMMTAGFIGGPGLTFYGQLEINGRLEGVRSSSNPPLPNFRFAAGSSLAGVGQIGNIAGRIQGTLVEIVDPQFTIPSGITLISATQYDSTDIIQAPGTHLRIEGRVVTGYQTQFGGAATDSWTFRVASLHTAGDIEVTKDGRMYVEGGPWQHSGHLVTTGGQISAEELVVESVGIVEGWGNVALGAGGLTVEGHLAPGSPEGQLTVMGDAIFASGSALAIDLRGGDNSNPASPQFDQLQVSGQAILAGLLDVVAAPEFFSRPFAIGDEYEILTATSVSGEFDAVSVNARHLIFDIIYSPTAVNLKIVDMIQIDGDFNLDGVVDAADYVAWRKTDNTPAGYDTWYANFGRTAGGSGSGSDGAVPEPSALLLVVAAAMQFAVRRRNRRLPR